MTLSPRYVLICDDHPVVARGLSELLKEHPQINAAVCTSTAQECLAYIETHGRPAIVVLDFWLQGHTCEPLARALTEQKIPVLMISADDDPLVQARCQQWGANGFISKQASPGVVREAVTCLVEGLGWFMPIAVAQSYQQNVNNRLPISVRELGLTTRQGQVLSMMLEGQPNKRIAQHLSLTEATIKEHVTGILQRLGVRSRVEAIAKLQHRRLEH
ncbi:MAG: response regulator transcription factor [Brachymonas sp.]|nr:response regulator transcription factor [Brachymonas sp.]